MSSVPIVGSAADLTGAIARAERSPSARAHVARRAAELGLSERIPASWGLTAAGPHGGGALGKIGRAIGAAWDEAVHPRDMNGQWIENGGHVDISAGHGSRRIGSGKVVGNTPDGRVLVAIEHGDGAGTTKTLSAGSLTKSADTRARLGEPAVTHDPQGFLPYSGADTGQPGPGEHANKGWSQFQRYAPPAAPRSAPTALSNDIREATKAVSARRDALFAEHAPDDDPRWDEIGREQAAISVVHDSTSSIDPAAYIAATRDDAVRARASQLAGLDAPAPKGVHTAPDRTDSGYGYGGYGPGADALDAAQARLPIDPAHPVARDLASATAEATGALRDPATNLRLAGRSGKATDEHRAALEAIIANPDHAAAHKDLAALMTSMTFGGKQRKRYRELLDAHHGKAADPASAGIEAQATADALAPDNPLKDRLAAKAAAPADIADAYRSGNTTWEESQALRDLVAPAADNLGPAGPHMVAAQESTRADYPLGSKVRVMLQGVDQGYDGEVVGYGRNGDAIVKEPNFGTTSHVMASELRTADLGFGTRPRGDLRSSIGVGLSDNGEGTPVRVTVWNPKGTQTVEVAPDAWKKIQPSFNEGSTPFGLTPEGNIMASPSSGGVSGERRVFDPKTGRLIEAFQIQMDGSKKPIAATEGDTRNSAGMSPEAAARAATPAAPAFGDPGWEEAQRQRYRELSQAATPAPLSDGTRPQGQIPDKLPYGRADSPSAITAEQAKIDAERTSLSNGNATGDQWVALGDRQTAVNEARTITSELNQQAPGAKPVQAQLAEVSTVYGPNVGKMTADLVAAEQAAPSAPSASDELNNRGGLNDMISEPTGPYGLPWAPTSITATPVGIGEAHASRDSAPSDPGFTISGNKLNVTDPNKAQYWLDNQYQIAMDNFNFGDTRQRTRAKTRRDALKKMLDAIQTEKVRQADGIGAGSPATRRPERARADTVAASEKAAADAKVRADHAAALKAFNAQQAAPAAPVALPLEPYGPLSERARLDIASYFTRDPAVKNAISVYLEEDHKAESGSLGFIHARRQSAMQVFRKAGITEREIGKRVDNYRNESGPDAGRKPVRSAPVGSRDTSPAVDLPPLGLGKPETAQAQADRLAQRYGPGSPEALAARTRATNESNRLARSTGISRVQAAEKMYGVDSPQAVAARKRFPDGGPTLPVASSKAPVAAPVATPAAAPTRQSIADLASSIRDAGGQGYDSPAGILQLVQSYASNVRAELADPSLKFVTIGVPGGSEVRIPRGVAQKAVDAYSTGLMSDAQALRILGVTDAAPGVTASGAPADLRKRILRKRTGGQ